MFLGNIHQSAINCDRLMPVGSTYKAEKESKLLGPREACEEARSQGEEWKSAGNFLVSEDPWFRPVSKQTGPDGALWMMDWYDKYPCYQNAQADPEGVDREHGPHLARGVGGRSAGQGGAEQAAARHGSDQVEHGRTRWACLISRNNWHRRQAQRLHHGAPRSESGFRRFHLIAKINDLAIKAKDARQPAWPRSGRCTRPVSWKKTLLEEYREGH